MKTKDIMRRPKTQNERRQNCSEDVRGKRKSTSVPTSWDDKIRSDIGDKSWKRNKKVKKSWMK